MSTPFKACYELAQPGDWNDQRAKLWTMAHTTGAPVRLVRRGDGRGWQVPLVLRPETALGTQGICPACKQSFVSRCRFCQEMWRQPPSPQLQVGAVLKCAPDEIGAFGKPVRVALCLVLVEREARGLLMPATRTT